MIRTTWLALGSITAAAALVSGTFNIVDLLAHEMETRVSTFDAAGITLVDVDDDAGLIVIEAADVEQITVRARIGHGLRRSGSSVQLEGDRLVVRGSCPVLGSQWCDVRYTIEVPADIDVIAHGDNDGVRVTGVKGHVDVQSNNGSIRVADLSGQVELSADNGRIDATGLTSSSVSARSANGGIELELLSPPQLVDVSTDNGNIVVVMPAGNEVYAVDLTAGNGNTDNRLRTDPASDRQVVAATDNGNVTLRYPG
jgi:hypothetical protein